MKTIFYLMCFIFNVSILFAQDFEIVEDTSKLYVFVGEKISVSKTAYSGFDECYIAKYKVLKNIYGDYSGDTIEFKVYDHYGVPAFSQYKNVMLFVSRHKGQLYHEKYQYFDVYKTINGRWASYGDPYKNDAYHRKKLTPVLITFADDIDAKPTLGAYAEDLFIVKKEGVLKARGFFYQKK